MTSMASIRTFTGKTVNLEKPTVESIDIRDIAHALSQINRFTGHTRRPYSVAEHSVIGSYFVRPELALEFLLHDATEAYLGDVSAPLKTVIGSSYAELEAGFARVIARKFRLRETGKDEIKRVDLMMRECEFAVLMRGVDRARVCVTEVKPWQDDYAGANWTKEGFDVLKRLHNPDTSAPQDYLFTRRYRDLLFSRMPDLVGLGF